MESINKIISPTFFLNEKYMELSAKNPRFSKRSLAKKLEINPGVLFQIMSGKRRITKDLALKICDRLNLSLEEKSFLLRQYEKQDVASKMVSYEQLSDKTEKLMTIDHFTFLSFLKLNEENHRHDHISRRMQIKVETLESVISDLLEMGLIEEKNNYYARTKKNIMTGDKKYSSSIRTRHKENLDKARESIENIDPELRDISAITMTVNKDKMIEARNLIREFQRNFALIMENSEGEEVYKMCVQFFPLTQEVFGEK